MMECLILKNDYNYEVYFENINTLKKSKND